MADVSNHKKISRLDFLKLAGSAGTAVMLLPFVPIGKALGAVVPATGKPVVVKRTNMAGPDGVAFVYPTKPKGFVWYMNHDHPFDSHFERGGGSTYVELIKDKDDSWTTDDNKSVKFNLNVDPNYKDAIGGCNMSFGDSMARGYTHDKSDLDNVELTGFFNVHKPTEHDGIYLRGPCNHHDEANHLCCQDFNYDCETNCNSTTESSKVKFTKQSPGTYYNDPAGVKTIVPSIILPGHGWFGIKYIHIILSRDMHAPKVKLEQWMNFNGDGKTWIKVNEVIDTRSYIWGPKAVCEGEDYEVGAWGAPRMVYKWYRGDVDFKWFSCRQIIPTHV